MATWKRFWALNRRDRGAALEAASVIVVTRAGLRIAGYRRWKSLLGKLNSFSAASPSASATTSASFSSHSRLDASCTTPANLTRLTAGAARRLFFHSTCLERSIALWWLLKRRGFDAEIHIGARKDGERFEAHAWVEHAGTVLSDAAGEFHRFAAFGDSHSLAGRQLR
jgi:hypothetical protein